MDIFTEKQPKESPAVYDEPCTVSSQVSNCTVLLPPVHIYNDPSRHCQLCSGFVAIPLVFFHNNLRRCLLRALCKGGSRLLWHQIRLQMPTIHYNVFDAVFSSWSSWSGVPELHALSQRGRGTATSFKLASCGCERGQVFEEIRFATPSTGLSEWCRFEELHHSRELVR